MSRYGERFPLELLGKTRRQRVPLIRDLPAHLAAAILTKRRDRRREPPGRRREPGQGDRAMVIRFRWMLRSFTLVSLVGCGAANEGAHSGRLPSNEAKPINSSSATPAQPWFQWRGPRRDGHSQETGLLAQWPAQGPERKWTARNLGIGYSGSSVVAGSIYTMGQRGGTTFALCLDAESGRERWATSLSGGFDNGWGNGPRSTPTVVDNRVFCLTASGELHCLDAKDGTSRWSVSLVQSLDAKVPSWGYCESPLVDGNTVLATPGGPHCMVGFNVHTGEKAWESKGIADLAQYASIVKSAVDSVPFYATMTNRGLVGIHATSGDLLFRFEKTANPTAVITTPIVDDRFIYSTSGYGTGCGLVKLTASGEKLSSKQVYFNKTMKNQHGGVILFEGHIYGYSDQVGWVCQHFSTGELVWKSDSLAKGSIIFAEGKCYCYSENDGTCVLIDASPAGWKERGRFQIPEHTELDRKSGHVWTHPVIADGTLLLRDQDLLFAYQIKAPKGETP